MMRMASFAATLMVTLVIISPCIYGKKFFDAHEVKVQRLLKRNKPAVKSIKSEDGDIIDCVPITRQPAFDHPLLKNHTVQMRPSFIPEGVSKFTRKEAITQVWRKNGECPENTVPIRRIRREDILRAKSVDSFGKKTHQSIPEEATHDPDTNHEYAVMGVNGNFFGTKFVVNTWKPKVENPKEFSLAQTWLVAGGDTDFNTIEGGWQVDPEQYGDNNIRLFVFWTNDGYQTGCYNIVCSGFVQRSNKITVGGSYTQISEYDGTQLGFSLLIWKDKESGNWWLMIGEEYVGYWPGSLFHCIGNGAKTIQWGGEIVNSRTGGKHTATQMGSGHFADEWYKKASYFRKLETVDDSNTLRDAEGLYSMASNDNCYTVKAGQYTGDSYWGNYFFYGGPGRNDKCV